MMFQWQTLSVVRRNRDVYLKNWKTSVIPPLMEPFVYFGAFGFGLGRFIQSINWNGHEVSYLWYISAGILATTFYNVSFFECLYATYVRMFYQKTFDAILNTRVEIQHIIRGEMLWASLKAAFKGMFVFLSLLLLQSLGYIKIYYKSIIIIFFFAILTALIFSAAALIFTSMVPSIDHFNYPVFLFAIPLSFTSNTYFPIDNIHWTLYYFAQVNPLYHLTEIIRYQLADGSFPPFFFNSILVLSLYGCILIPVAERKMTRRILGEIPGERA
ncbi:ABC transporter permease [Candidatus Riflebacteria bacterium]